jgi:aminopeptidase N
MNLARRTSITLLTILLLTATLTASTSAADTYPRQPGIDVQEYVFRLWLSDDTDRIEGLTTVDLRARDAGVESVALDLAVLREGSNLGMLVAGVWLARGTDVEAAMAASGPDRGEQIEFRYGVDRIVVPLGAPTRQGERLAITVQYSGEPETGLKIGPNKYGDRSFFSDNWPTRAHHWLPTIDHVSDKARSQMVVTAPAHYQVVSNGLLVEESDLPLADGSEVPMRLTHWRQSVPIAPWLYVLGVARFAVQTLAPFDGKPVQTWVYAQDRDAGFHDFAVPTHDVLAFYSEMVGPYAYEKLANIQSNSVGGGMEAASAIFYGDDSVTGDRSVRWRNVVIHEIAHQWFGNAVTEADWDDVWLSEGFATYFTLLFREHAYGRDDFVEGLRQARQRIFDFYAERPDYRIIHDNLDDMSQVTTGMTYQKGAWVLHMLRQKIGTETFWEGIRRYYARHFNGNATTADFRATMQEVSGTDLGWFFDQWLYEGGIPSLRLDWSHDEAAGEVVVTVQQTQPVDTLYRLPLTVSWTDAEGEHFERLEIPAARSATLRFSAPQAPGNLRLDPDTELLARFESGT